MNFKHMSLAIAGVAFLAGAPAVSADHRSYRAPVSDDGYRYDRHYRYSDERRYMPRWLKRHDRFRTWYGLTRLKYHRGLSWGELYSIFIWERRYSNHRRYHRYRDHAYRPFGYYRDYWQRGPRHRGRHHDRYGGYRHDKRGKHRHRQERGRH